ncbi:MAG: MarR family transcriptional regulator [Promethearchaeota archaeon]
MANEIFIKEMLDSKEFFTPIQYNLIKTLARSGPLTRKELVNQLRTPRTTIYDNLLKLQKRKMVEKFSRNDGKRGRPLIFWKIKD